MARGRGSGNFTRILTPGGFAVFESPFGDGSGAESMSWVTFTVDDSLGPGSVDTDIDERDRTMTDRARGGPRMRRPTEAKRRQFYLRGNAGYENA